MTKLLKKAALEEEERIATKTMYGSYTSFVDGFEAGYEYALEKLDTLKKNDYSASMYFIEFLQKEFLDE